jgi:hypothetical protein
MNSNHKITVKEIRVAEAIGVATRDAVRCSAAAGDEPSLRLAPLGWSRDGCHLCITGEMFDLHRYVLAARSSVFMAELFGSMKEKTTT